MFAMAYQLLEDHEVVFCGLRLYITIKEIGLISVLSEEEKEVVVVILFIFSLTKAVILYKEGKKKESVFFA